jgi:hypothetical protein
LPAATKATGRIRRVTRAQSRTARRELKAVVIGYAKTDAGEEAIQRSIYN